MTESTMPAAEAEVMTDDREVASYELAFHVLPTVAEGEVTAVLENIKQEITTAGGTVGLQEVPQRFDLAYEITKLIDGKYRRFDTAYFGWVRFTAVPTTVADILSEVEGHELVLRAMLVRLTKQEEAHPFYIHESRKADKRVVNVEAEEVADDTSDDDEDTDTDSDDDTETETT